MMNAVKHVAESAVLSHCAWGGSKAGALCRLGDIARPGRSHLP